MTEVGALEQKTQASTVYCEQLPLYKRARIPIVFVCPNDHSFEHERFKPMLFAINIGEEIPINAPVRQESDQIPAPGEVSSQYSLPCRVREQITIELIDSRNKLWASWPVTRGRDQNGYRYQGQEEKAHILTTIGAAQGNQHPGKVYGKKKPDHHK